MAELIVLLIVANYFRHVTDSPPRLMDDVDAVQAQIARNMLQSGDWVSAHLDGVLYLEKSPLKYWMIAVCFRIFGVHDWAARIPISLSAILLCWLVTAWGGGPWAQRRASMPGSAWQHAWDLALYQGPDSGRGAHAFDRFRHVVLFSRSGTGRVEAASVGAGVLGGHRRRHAAQRADRGRFSSGNGVLLSAIQRPLAGARNLEALVNFARNRGHACDRGALACARDAPQPTVVRLHDAQRAWLLSRVLLVLFF